ncbi:hypothetical protein BDQ12DRAFT_275920 [Crucibulum laeve]|uniref:U2 small nuclear ribonucleoprotein A' n=1 Tax=Crucibulum laeve TaxID=68775 RepID=A0A5C3MAF0_9AGAR|nr:hypothetical protein BDQ12DRAFT_275920 [Crucibulum laeve]
MHLPEVGTRLNYSGHLGTVKFVGSVNNTTGVWIGVEWDEAERGKHDGVKDNKRYFSCRIPNSGSFIRPSANISYGISFVDALVSRYIENPHGSGSQEKVLLGSSQGAIQLREVSLDKEHVAKSDPPGTIQNTCPNIRGLDLSLSLLPSWDEVALITNELLSLQTLALNRTRLDLLNHRNTLQTAFKNLQELCLNGTLTTWPEMQYIKLFMPKLRLIEMGYNHLVTLSSDPSSHPVDNSTIEIINLDSNRCIDWAHVCVSLSKYPSLQRVILASNQIDTIPLLDSEQQQLTKLKHLALSDNDLHAWSSVDALSSWCPALETLTLCGNPILNDTSVGINHRAFVVAKIPTLLTLDGTAISSRERTDCEIFYLSYIVKYGPASEDKRCQAHPRWLDLCNKHGKPDESDKGKNVQDKLSDRLIELHLHRCEEAPVNKGVDVSIPSVDTLSLRVLPTMSLRNLRMKICKTLKRNFTKSTVRCWLRMEDGMLVELEAEQDTRDLDWLGLENGSHIMYVLKER